MSDVKESASGTTVLHGRRVAVTGATGFVGLHLVRRLVQCGAEVVALVRQTSDCSRLAELGVDCAQVSLEDVVALRAACLGCEIVFHVAGAVDFESDWDRFERVNVRGTRNILTAARAAKVRRVVHTSSIVAVGASAQPRILDETTSWSLKTLHVPYVTTKRQAEEEALAASGPELEVVVVNPASVIGPDDFTASEFGTLCRRFWRGRIPVYFGGGNNIVDVRDVAEGHLLAALHGRSGERYILGGTNRTTTAFFADLARAAHSVIARLPLPNALGGAIAAMNERMRNPSSKRSYLTPGQAQLASLYFFFSSAKAVRELGFRPRPMVETVRDTHAFWIGRRAA